VLVLRCFLLLGFEGLLAIALDHDDREEAADDGGAQDDEDDRDADGPDAWEEERVEEVVVVDKWLRQLVIERSKSMQVLREGTCKVVDSYHEQCPDGVVDEDGGCCDEHAEADEAVELRIVSFHSASTSWEARRTILKYCWVNE
jgi:hypothetical protein